MARDDDRGDGRSGYTAKDLLTLYGLFMLLGAAFWIVLGLIFGDWSLGEDASPLLVPVVILVAMPFTGMGVGMIFWILAEAGVFRLLAALFKWLDRVSR